MSAGSESSAPSLSAGAEWRVEALRLLVALWKRRGLVAVEDVESVVPDGAAEFDLRELIADLSAAGVEIPAEEGDRYGPASASVLSRYYRDSTRLLDSDDPGTAAAVTRNDAIPHEREALLHAETSARGSFSMPPRSASLPGASTRE